LLKPLFDFTPKGEEVEEESKDEPQPSVPSTPPVDTTVPSQQRRPDNSLWSSANLPLLAMGARILQSPGQSPLTALGAGLSEYINETKSQNSAAAEGKQAQFDNMLKIMNAQQYAKQNDIQIQRLAFEAEKLPLEKGKLQAEVKKMEAEAAALGDPSAQEAAKMTQKQIQDAPNMYKPEDIPALFQSNYANVQQIRKAQGRSEDTSLGDPLKIRLP
jgi:hypothetical protein